MQRRSLRSSQSKFIAPLPSPERVRVAQELHDGIAQDLVGLGYQIDLLLSHEDLSLQARADIRTARFGVTSLIEKVRREILELRSGEGEDLSRQLHELLLTLPLHPLEVSCDIEEVFTSERNARELVLIATEILRNCVEHSRATRIDISLSCINNRIHLVVSDDGVGGVEMKENHWGIIGIQERVNQIGAELTVNSTSKDGTSFHITL